LFPKALKAYIPQLKALYEPIPKEPETTNHGAHTNYLTNEEAQSLIDLLNAKEGHSRWTLASSWTKLSVSQKKSTSPLSSQCQIHRHFVHFNVTFSTWLSNRKNSVISVKPDVPAQIHFSRIEAIFTHHQTSGTGERLTDTWLKVKGFRPLPHSNQDPYTWISNPEVQAALQLQINNTDPDYIISINDIVAHCAWIEYQSGKLTPKLNKPVVALVCVDCR
jgi:hypothetical protein